MVKQNLERMLLLVILSLGLVLVLLHNPSLLACAGWWPNPLPRAWPELLPP